MPTLQQIKQRYDIVGNDSKLDFAINKAVQVAPTDLSILVTGESGVGKDVFSRIVHDCSSRKHRTLVSVNCGAIPVGTIESELFGHLKGSFTGADKDRKGYFQEADGGTIFLDEVGELPPDMQVKLLRVLENGEIIPVGQSTAIKVDVRVVAATNVDLLAAVRSGRFREDLYYRLNQIAIHIPPLRERATDIPLLFRKFSSDIAERYHIPPIFLADDARQYLMHYPWYGNIRELKNITEQMSVIEKERTITHAILTNYLTPVSEETMPTLFISDEAGHRQISDRELLLKALSMGQMINELRGEISELRHVVTQLAQGVPIADVAQYEGGRYAAQPQHPLAESAVPQLPAVATSSYQETDAENDEFDASEVIEDDAVSLDEREKLAILAALERNKGKRKQTAQELNISERTLYRKLKSYDL